MDIHHYMVDFEDKDGNVQFANDTHINDLAKAKQLAQETSHLHGSAFVIAFVPSAKPSTFAAVGDIKFIDGVEGDLNGRVA